ncbi:single-stranded DNA-binding protein [Secundilactobacillus pentosiphilus]|uniref:Single-stranded DNA-binding protein n=1 Tax=Secundilactobacillus pentosiphilus TaxID=1714682 RepID=A0A1Z5IZL4_9LACO|nr:single-stranded DNA-binding protein [Secundilactobacillus pentosiphilus]GAX06978.1 single-stranded DNA-binding protein [Secundilactobacillus pentosiphilus]
MINRVVLTGRLTRDVDLRYTASGTAVGNFTLAVDQRYKSQNGERGADFPQCIIWQKSAENLANYTHKGSLIGVEGRLQTRKYTNKDGQDVYVTEVVVENFAFLEARRNNTSGSSNGTGNGNQPANDANNNTHAQGGDNPRTNPKSDPFTNNADSIDISDDDLPF